MDAQIFVIDVAGGAGTAQRSGRNYSDLLVVAKTDLAALVGADLAVMARDGRGATAARQCCNRPRTQLPAWRGLGSVVNWRRWSLVFWWSRRRDRLPRIDCRGESIQARQTAHHSAPGVSGRDPLGVDTMSQVIVETGCPATAAWCRRDGGLARRGCV